MPEPRVQRTLVKSPPELWAEVSDFEALARHLGEFGEIRITRLEPETTVAWEGDRARGTVELEPAGWGTKVTITAQLAAAEAPTVAIEPVAAEPEPVEAEPVAEVPGSGSEEEAPEPVAAQTRVAELEPTAPEPPPAEPEQATPEPESTPSEPAPEQQPSSSELAAEPRSGFFARLFGRRKGERVVVEEPEAEPDAETEPVAVEAERVVVEEPEAEPDAETEPVAVEAERVVVEEPEAEPVAESEPVAVAEPQPEPVDESEPVAIAEPEPQPVAEPVAPAAESLDDDRAHAILTGVLDDLGSAHHRPFSRG
jgi:hypothetical protein